MKTRRRILARHACSFTKGYVLLRPIQLRPISTLAKFDSGHFFYVCALCVCVCVLCGCVVLCVRVLCVVCSARPPLRRTAQNFALVFLSPAPFSLFFPSWGVFSWSCGRGSRPWTTQSVRPGFLVPFCEPWRPAVRFGPLTLWGLHSSRLHLSGPHPFGPQKQIGLSRTWP